MIAQNNGVDIDFIKDENGVGFSAYLTNGFLGLAFTAFVSVVIIAGAFVAYKKFVGKMGFKAQMRAYAPMVFSGFIFTFGALLMASAGSLYWAGNWLEKLRGG